MGFGYLFLGYLISLNFFVYPYLTLLPATLLMLTGMLRLSLYNRPLREATWALYPTAVAAVLAFVLEGGRFLGVMGLSLYESLSAYLSPLFLIMLAIFTDRLLVGLSMLGKETELPKVQFAATRNRLFSLVAYLSYLICSLPVKTDWYASIVAHAWAPVLLLRLIVTFMNAFLIYSCYMQICLPEDVDMPRHKTGIGFLDAWNEKMDAREEAAQAEKKQALADLYHEREKKYKEKQNQKKGRKK